MQAQLETPFADDEWLVDKLLVRNGVILWSGQPKIGKSWLAVDLARSVASGRPFLGRDVTHAGSVLYIAAERNKQTFNRIVNVNKREGLPQHPIFVYAPKLNKRRQLLFQNEADVDFVIDEIAPIPSPELIIVDSLDRTNSGNDAITEDMRKYIMGVEQLSSACDDATVVIIHHNTKEYFHGDGRKSGGHTYRGSTGIFASVNSWVSITRESDALRVKFVDGNEEGGEFDKCVVNRSGVFEVVDRGVSRVSLAEAAEDALQEIDGAMGLSDLAELVSYRVGHEVSNGNLSKALKKHPNIFTLVENPNNYKEKLASLVF